MPLTILNVAYPLAPVGPDAVGGTEQVLTQIDAALTRAGHRSIVIACTGSTAAGELITTPRAEGMLHTHMQAELQQLHRAQIEAVVAHHHVDVVHLHGVDFHTYLPRANVPVLVTLHLPPSWHAAEAFQLRRPSTFLHCVSQFQEHACPASLKLLPAIENGVPVETLRG